MHRTALLVTLAAALLCAPPRARCASDELMGSVVRSKSWKMDRKNNLEFFDGSVSFRNPSYSLLSEHAVYDHNAKRWDISGSARLKRILQDASVLDVDCEKARYMEPQQKAFFERGASQVAMRYTSPGAKALFGFSDSAAADSAQGIMTFEGDFRLRTEGLSMISRRGLYSDAEKSFLMYESTPVAVGFNEDYNFAVTAEKMKFFKDTRDIKFHNKVSGWIRNTDPSGKPLPARGKTGGPK